MALYSLSCSIYSFTIEKLVKKFRARPVYAGGQLVYSIGMVFMALARSKLGVIVFSCSAGIMYSTLFTMPYLIVAHYHETDTVSFHKSNVSKYYYILTYIVTFYLCISSTQKRIGPNHLKKKLKLVSSEVLEQMWVS